MESKFSKAIGELQENIENIEITATGKYCGEIMQGKLKEGEVNNRTLTKICGLFTVALGIAFVTIKSIFNSESQIMGITSVKDNGDYLSFIGFCMQQHKKTPQRGDRFNVHIDTENSEIFMKLRNALNTFDQKYRDANFFNKEFYFLNTEKENNILMKQMLIWLKTNNMRLSKFIKYFTLPSEYAVAPMEDLLGLYMLQLSILASQGKEITELHFYQDLTVLCHVLYYTNKISPKELSYLNEKYKLEIFPEVAGNNA